jgi:uncharacterized protein (TIGR00725 family)
MTKEAKMITKDAKRRQVSVVGSSDANSPSVTLAVEVGRAVAELGAALICGGLGGAMEAAARGAKERGGLTIGIVPTYRKDSANAYLDIVIPSGLGHARNVLVVASGDVVIALPGSHGTRSEVSLALALGKPVIGVAAWSEIENVQFVSNTKELLQKLCLIIEQNVSS